MTRKIISEEARQLIRDNPDAAYEIKMSGVDEGMKHVEPSEKTLNLIKRMEEKFDKLKDEIVSKVSNIEVSLERTVRDIFDKIDEKYARKEKVNNLVNEVNELRSEREKRNYEWLKFGITAILSGTIGVILANFYN